MKTLSPKPGGKGGKIHPSPASEDPIRAAFRLLPAAILVLVAGLGPEDRDVLAYFVTMPGEAGPLPKDAAAAVPPPSEHPPSRGGGRGGGGRRRAGCHPAPGPSCVGHHPPTHGCGCFDCYTSFWARWNLSPQRDRILDAVEAFEEHLAVAAKAAAAAPPSPSRRRDRGRRSRVHAAPAPASPPPHPLPMPMRLPKSSEAQVVEAVPEPTSTPPPCCLPPPPPPPEAQSVHSTAQMEEEEEKVVPQEEEPATAAEPDECREVVVMESGEEERKRGWAGVLGLRLWGIWSPAVESAT